MEPKTKRSIPRRMMQFSTCLMLLLCAHFSIQAQQNVTGKVVSSKDQAALTGVTVQVKGTSKASITNNDGNFTIQAKNGSTLLFSFVGFLPKELKVNGNHIGTITLDEDVKSLSSVVVVGYGTQKKVNLTGSVATIDMTEKEGQPITNVSNALHGAPGLFVNLGNSQPGVDRATIRIRGMGTLNNNDPLVLVDGIEYSMDELNPADIATISILKDASAAIYGSKAANGVILVTTKTGRGTPKVNYSYYYGTQKPTMMPDVIWDPIAYMKLKNQALENIGKVHDYSDTRDEVVTQILKDLDSAALVLPLKYSKADIGRATKGAAMALKARVLLYEASPLFNASNDAQKWKAAADAAKAVMDLPGTGYGLFADYRGLFLPQNENNKEVIFDVQYIFPGLGTSFDLIGKQYNTNAPLLDLAEAYDMNNGLPITDPASGYDPAKPYANRDPRLYGTIFFPGDTLMQVKVTNSRFAVIGFGMKKYTIYDKGPAPTGQSDLKAGQSETNFIILRYADILMMYAEALNEASGPLAEVYDALNAVRQRVKLPAIDPAVTTYTKDELRQIIHHERRIEFAGEGLYYNDIRRWKTAETVLNAPIKTYDGSQIEVRTFDPTRDYFWPIPLPETDLNPNLEQNPGY